MADGYSAIWAAKTEVDATKALEDSKAALLKVVQDYVKFLADTVYNKGEATVIGDKSYTVSETDYNTAVTAITGAENVAKVLNAYNTMLSAQTSKQHPYLTKTEAKAATYTETGNNEYYTCSVCQKVFKDAAGTQETTVEAETIAKLTRPSSGGSSSRGDRDPSYAVSTPSTKNGDVTVSPKNASKGDRVTITVTPDKGYELDKLTVKGASGNKLKLTDKGNGKYTFPVPGSKVTVSAEFVEEQAGGFRFCGRSRRRLLCQGSGMGCKEGHHQRQGQWPVRLQRSLHPWPDRHLPVSRLSGQIRGISLYNAKRGHRKLSGGLVLCS